VKEVEEVDELESDQEQPLTKKVKTKKGSNVCIAFVVRDSFECGDRPP
jgi:hypothetical protein